MKFTVSSTELLHALLSVSRAIPAKPSIPIIENFLFVLRDNRLEITATDLDLTLRTALPINLVDEDGQIAVPAKLLTDSLKEFPELPLTFTSGNDGILEIKWQSGASKIPFSPADEFPSLPAIDEESSVRVEYPADILMQGLTTTIYAAAEDELRPVMNGVFFDMNTDSVTLVASDSHKLVSYTRNDIHAAEKCSFILPKKPANILKSLIGKYEGNVSLIFNNKNACFAFEDSLLICRLVEGNYPAYRTVIPKNNTNKLTINRREFLNAAKRVSVCSNQSASYLKLSLSFNQLIISAQDTSFSVAAHEALPCQYDGDKMDIGFKSSFLIEVLSNLAFEEASLELADPSRAALILDAGEHNPCEEVCSLLMPVRLA